MLTIICRWLTVRVDTILGYPRLSECLLLIPRNAAFLRVFNNHHPNYEASTTMRPNPTFNDPYEQLPNQMSFRLKLLKFVALYMLPRRNDRPTPTVSQLKDFRKRNMQRAERWYATTAHDNAYSSTPRLLNYLERYSGHELVEGRSPIDLPVTTLLDLIPSFIELTVARARMHKRSNNKGEPLAMDWDTAPQWLELAGQLMLQAATEHTAAHGYTEIEGVKEAFAWGPRIVRDDDVDQELGAKPRLPQISDESEGSFATQRAQSDHERWAHDNLNEIFRMDTPESQIRPVDNYYLVTALAWLKIRDANIERYMRERDRCSFNSSRSFPSYANDRRGFDHEMTGYLRGLQASLDRPLLTQLEDNSEDKTIDRFEIDGMKLSAEGSESLLRIWKGEKR